MRKIFNIKRIFIILLIIVIIGSFMGCKKDITDDYVPQLRVDNSLPQFYYNFEVIFKICEDNSIPIDQELKDNIHNDLQQSINLLKVGDLGVITLFFKLLSVYEYFEVDYDRELYVEKLHDLYDTESKLFHMFAKDRPGIRDMISTDMVINRILLIKLHDSSIDISFAGDIIVEKLNSLDIDDDEVAYQYLYELSLIGRIDEVDKEQLINYFALHSPIKPFIDDSATSNTALIYGMPIYKYNYYLEYMGLPYDNTTEGFRELFVRITDFENLFSDFNGPSYLTGLLFEQNPYDFYGENEYFRDNINNWLVNYYNEYRSTIFYYA